MKEKILIVAQNGLNIGGIQAVLMGIVRNLSNKYTFDIIVFTHDVRYYEREFESYGGHVFRITHNKANSFLNRADIYFRYAKDKREIEKIIRENGPYKAIHCNNDYESAIALEAAKNYSIPVRIIQAHIIRKTSNHFIRRILDNKYKSIMTKDATVKIGCSEMACESMFGNGESFSVINNSYNEKRYIQENYPQVHFESPVLIQIGNYSSLKNQLYSLRVFSVIKKQYPGASMNFVGFDVGGYINLLEDEIKILQLEDCVKLYHSDADSPYLLSQSCYFMLPSTTEAFGIVLVEAQAMGLTCFVSDVVPKASNVGGCHYLTIKDDPEIWAQTIIDDFTNTKGIHKQYDCSKFSSDYIAQKYDSLYNGGKI